MIALENTAYTLFIRPVDRIKAYVVVNAGTCNLLRSLLSPVGFQTLAPRYGSVLYLLNLLTLPIKAPYGTKSVGTQCADKAAKVRTLRQKCPRGARMA